MRVRVVAFARLREALGASELFLEIADGSQGALWSALIASSPEVATLKSATRIARNGRVLAPGDVLAEGDDVALLPPVSGG